VRHEIFAFDFEELSLRVEFGRVEESEKDTSRRPGEFVSERVVRRLGSRETSTVRDESSDLWQTTSMSIIETKNP